MGTATGSIGSAGAFTYLGTPVYTGIDLGNNIYPKGSITFPGIKANGAYWLNNHLGYRKSANIYLCDANGNNKKLLFAITLEPGATSSTVNSASVTATGLEGKKLYLIATGDSDYIVLRNATQIKVTTATLAYSITCWQTQHGGLSASKSSAQAGDTITLTPTPDSGYEFDYYEATSGVTISNHKFTMPAKNVEITPHFKKIKYNLTKKTNPTGAGTVTTKVNNAAVTQASEGDLVTLEQTPGTGSLFTGWTISPARTITSNTFVMPAQAVTVTANYKIRSTATLDSTTLTGGEYMNMTIRPSMQNTYTHRWKVSFGENMQTDWETLAVDVSTVLFSVPSSWASYIPTATSKAGTLTLETYEGSTLIGTYTISVTYAVPTDAEPLIGLIMKSIVRTIDGTTYGNIGNVYAQNHCGVRVQVQAFAYYGASITEMTVRLAGYSGGGTAAAASIDWTSGLLTIAGTQTITVTATDSRGITKTASTTIEVLAYQKPAGELDVWRVNAGGTADVVGNYANYLLSKAYSQIGNNTLTATLTTQGESATTNDLTGELLPGHRLTFSLQEEHEVTLTLTDGLESTVITAIIPSARFVMYVNSNGTKLAFFKTADRPIPTGKETTFEISEDTQVYIGDDTLEDFIKGADKQDPVSDPTASGTDVSFIASISQSVKGVITALKKTVRTFGASGSGAKTGLVPAPSSTAGTAKYLREDATWQKPPWRGYQIVTKTYTYASTSANGTRNLKGSDFGFTTPSGYVAAGIVGFYSGNVGMAVSRVQYGTGDSTVMSLRNVTTSSISSPTASISVLFIQTGT